VTQDKLNALIGIPWGLTNCWSLCQLAYLEAFAIALPGYSTIDPADTLAVAAAIEAGRADWHAVDGHARRGDILLFCTDSLLPTHVAFALDEARMLHVTEGSLSRIDWYDQASWRGRMWAPRLRGIYRHRAMIERATG
jgi:cell wall-associated NlpC family hydrolase